MEPTSSTAPTRDRNDLRVGPNVEETFTGMEKGVEVEQGRVNEEGEGTAQSVTNENGEEEE
ncbi:unnamed protein product, partial [Linum tenue]